MRTTITCSISHQSRNWSECQPDCLSSFATVTQQSRDCRSCFLFSFQFECSLARTDISCPKSTTACRYRPSANIENWILKIVVVTTKFNDLPHCTIYYIWTSSMSCASFSLRVVYDTCICYALDDLHCIRAYRCLYCKHVDAGMSVSATVRYKHKILPVDSIIACPRPSLLCIPPCTGHDIVHSLLYLPSNSPNFCMYNMLSNYFCIFLQMIWSNNGGLYNYQDPKEGVGQQWASVSWIIKTQFFLSWQPLIWDLQQQLRQRRQRAIWLLLRWWRWRHVTFIIVVVIICPSADVTSSTMMAETVIMRTTTIGWWN